MQDVDFAVEKTGISFCRNGVAVRRADEDARKRRGPDPAFPANRENIRDAFERGAILTAV
jgi:hypothetical protein